METGSVSTAQGTTTPAPTTTQNSDKTATGVNLKTPINAPDKKATEGTEPAKKYTILTAEGTEREVDLDTYKRWSQKLAAADKYLAESKTKQRAIEEQEYKIKQQAQEIEAMRKAAPSQKVKMLLQELQDDPNQLKEFRGSVEDWLVSQLQEEQASPEMQRAMKAERELEKYRKQQEDAQKKSQEEQKMKAIEQARPMQEKFILESLQLTGLPPTEWNVKSVADVMYNARVKGHKVTPQQVAAIVKEDRVENIRAVAGDFAKKIVEARAANDFDSVIKMGDQMVEVFGEDIIKALRIYDIRKHTASKPEMPKPVIETSKAETKHQGAYEYKNVDEWAEARKRAVASMPK